MDLCFVRPDEAPVFSPSPEEFSDPLLYISSITPLASQYGICKIRPPQDWRPTFCPNAATFSFAPRIQNLSDICAYNRVKQTFITSVISFWEAQESTLFAPYIKGKLVDIFCLWKVVQSHGGFEVVCEQKLWCSVSQQLGFGAIPQYAAALCAQYKRILSPYERFLVQKKSTCDVSDVPRRQIANHKRKITVGLFELLTYKQVKKLTCSVCGVGKDEDYLLLCDDCETLGACHTYCLQPPLSDVPKGSWFCPKCVSRRFNKLHRVETFGFKRSRRQRTLENFANFADDFKMKHFGKPSCMISLTDVETEFWRLMHSENTDVVVEYGADLSAREFGSGFPMASRDSSDKYVTSPWNLNNLSVAERSALRFLPRDISGMIVPWVYVGMVFSCFCWHTEDHWSYSINYLHTGSPKTWYGVPTDSADAFEAAMRAEVPELFEVSPDLLHHITTMLSPSKIQAHGVPVYRLDQLAGEFVITFPRAYHAGFNQGFNFAEAVNFCPPDWVGDFLNNKWTFADISFLLSKSRAAHLFEMGQSCIEHYAVFRRAPVFSHAELLCRMTLSEEPLSVEFLVVVLKQLRNLFATERDLRRHLARLGVRRAERMVFEDSDDDQRECAICRTTLYLSALACKCSSSMVCLTHHEARTCCAHEEQVMRYRYGLDELSESIDKLNGQLEDYRRWQHLVEQAVHMANGEKIVDPVFHPQTGFDDVERLEHLVGDDSSPTSLSSAKTSPSPSDIFTPKRASVDGPKLEPCSSEHKMKDPELSSLTDLRELVNIGHHRKYPQSDMDKLTRLVRTLEECSVIARDLLHSYRLACAKDSDLSSNACTVKAQPSDTESESSVTSEDSSSEEVQDDEIATASDNSQKILTSPKQMKSEKQSIEGSPISSPRRVQKGRELFSLAEFDSWMRIAADFRYFLPELLELNQMQARLISWRERATELILTCDQPACPNDDAVVESMLSISLVDDLLRFADAIIVDLPETIRLKKIHECLSWREAVQSTLDQSAAVSMETDAQHKPSLDYLCELQSWGELLSSTIAYVSVDQSNELSLPTPQTTLDVILAECSRKLLTVIESAKRVEERFISVKNASAGSVSLDEVLKILETTTSLPIWLPVAQEIKQLCAHAQLTAQRFETIEKLLVASPFGLPMRPLDPHAFPNGLYEQLALGTVDCTSHKWKACVETILDEESESPIHCSQLSGLLELLNFVNLCRDRTIQLFLKPRTKLTLLEALLPRSDRSLEFLINLDAGSHTESVWAGKRGSRNPGSNLPAYDSFCKENALEFVQALVSCESVGQLYDSVYHRFVEAELSLLHRLRGSNMFKSRSKNQQTVTYCVCRKTGFFGFMVQCELCRDWFHGRCAMLPYLKETETDRLRYMCPRCERTLRPDLEQVLHILDELVRVLPVAQATTGGSPPGPNRRVLCLVRLPEFVALQMLCERAFLFIRHLRSTIQSNHELSQAVAKYEQFAGLKMPLYGCSEDLESISTESAESVSSSNYPIKAFQRLGGGQSGSRIAHSASKLTARLGQKHSRSPSSGPACELEPSASGPGSHFLKSRKSSTLVRDGIGRQGVDRSREPETEAAEALAGMSSTMFSLTESERRPCLSPTESHASRSSLINSTTWSLQLQAERNVMVGNSSSNPQKASHRPKPISMSPAHMSVQNTTDAFNAHPNTSQSEAGSHVRPRNEDREVQSHPDRQSQSRQPTKYFNCSLSPDARKLLETLIMEASLLEVSLPQTRWLWQLHLASDPENTTNGATKPHLARLEEMKLKRRFLHQLCQTKESGRLPAGIKRKRALNARSGDDGAPDRGEEMLHLGMEGYTSSSPSSSESSERDAPVSSFNRIKLESGTRSPKIGVRNRRETIVKRKPYRVRSSGLSTSITRRYDLSRIGRLQTIRRSLNGHRFRTSIPSNSARTGLSQHVKYHLGPKVYQHRAVAAVLKSQFVRERNETHPSGKIGGQGVRIRGRRSYRGSPFDVDHHGSSAGHMLDDCFSSHSEEPYGSSDEQTCTSTGPLRKAPTREHRPSGPRRRASRAVSALGRERGVSSQSGSAHAVTDEDDCAASPCQHPRTGTVEWIACDSCGQWFHQLCVGIRNKNQVPKDFVCNTCMKHSQALTNVHHKRRLALDSARVHPSQFSGLHATMPMREFPRRRSHLNSNLASGCPVGWASGGKPVGFGSRHPANSSAFRIDDNVAAHSRASDLDSANQVTDSHWTNYSPTSSPDESNSRASKLPTFASNEPHSSNISSYSGLCQVVSQRGSNEKCPPSLPIQPSQNVDIKDPTEVLLEAIDVVNAKTAQPESN
ncbi:hypothetical protein PHET_02650 [Paragonimus heterotremus]|uniref:[histone H3]-trimethyl-L-lysine(4) demethylase n=1 Tax=Paragonimus heterotremus TaxID=100268 RepID=A0A8J4WIK9_9TREM|nr:hypothetical protein PHET_02650 [Paragonimus heterotremus]